MHNDNSHYYEGARYPQHPAGKLWYNIVPNVIKNIILILYSFIDWLMQSVGYLRTISK